MTYKPHHKKPSQEKINKYIMLLNFANKNDYHLTINKTNNLKLTKMETKDLNKGVLFKNTNKKTDNHPDYNGKIVLSNGKEYYLNAWINESKSGQEYMSLSIGNETTITEPKKEVKPMVKIDEPPF
jgi:uncharacterized protein (DUF736 family)